MQLSLPWARVAVQVLIQVLEQTLVPLRPALA